MTSNITECNKNCPYFDYSMNHPPVCVFPNEYNRKTTLFSHHFINGFPKECPLIEKKIINIPELEPKQESFETELETLLKSRIPKMVSHIPDHVLAEYVKNSLYILNKTLKKIK